MCACKSIRTAGGHSLDCKFINSEQIGSRRHIGRPVKQPVAGTWIGTADAGPVEGNDPKPERCGLFSEKKCLEPRRAMAVKVKDGWTDCRAHLQVGKGATIGQAQEGKGLGVGLDAPDIHLRRGWC